MDLNDPMLTRTRRDSAAERLALAREPDELPDRDADPLDTPEMTQKHRVLLRAYQSELDRQRENREQMAIDAGYYDGQQWTESEIWELGKRGQAPLVFNVVKTTVNWVLGSEKRGRTDFKVLPREKNDAGGAQRKTELLKYLSDVNRTPFHRSHAFADAVKVGVGWLEDGYQDSDDGEPIYSGGESWRNVLHDSSARLPDLNDGRYQFRVRWTDLDMAEAYFRGRVDLLRRAAAMDPAADASDITMGDEAMDEGEMERRWSDISGAFVDQGVRSRVKLIECWWKEPHRPYPVLRNKIPGRPSPFAGQIYEDADPRHQEALQSGTVHLGERLMTRLHVYVFCASGILACGPSPYRHNRFPFTPIWGYRRDSNNLPYGMIRDLRDPQSDMNKRFSKSLYILSTNKVIMEKGAVDDIKKLIQEANRPDGVIEINANKRLELDADRGLEEAHMNIMALDRQMVQQAGGVTDENLGRETNARSGIAIARRQEQGSIATTEFFDNLRLAVQIQGENQLSLIEQYMTEPKQFRITNQRGQPTFVSVNDGLPENDITRSKADFIISEQDWRASMRQAQAEALLELMTKLPEQVAMAILDLVIELMDLPNREEIAKRIRALTGQMDPDLAEDSPEAIAQQQAKIEAMTAQRAMAEAELVEKQATGLLKLAQAKKAQADMLRARVGAMGDATQAALTVAQVPVTAPMADTILQEAGMEGAFQDPPKLGLPPPPPPPPPAPEQPAAAPVVPPSPGPAGPEAQPQ